MGARTRYIKPEFFTNEQLGELTAHHRLLFLGLWCYADRRGRLKDSPKRLAIWIFPFEQIDTNELLDGLHLAGLITRYKVDEEPLIQINSFEKHQKTHPKEPESCLPPPKKTTTWRVMHTRSRVNIPGYSYSKSNSKSTVRDKNTGLDKPMGIDSPGGMQGGEDEVFLAYCKSWGRNQNSYQLTGKRRQWIKTAIEQHGLENCLKAVQRFRADPFENRANFNGIEYLFGKQERIDRWCSDGLFAGKAFTKAQAEHRESTERLELAKQMLKERQAKNGPGYGTNTRATEQPNRDNERREADSQGADAVSGNVGGKV